MVIRRLYLIGLLTGLLFAGTALAMPDIELNAILGKQVIATIDDQQIKLKLGESTPDGLKLTAVTSKSATFEWQGETAVLEPSSRIGNKFSDGKKKNSFTISSDASGHYFINGEINGHSAYFLIDTGATDVSLTEQQASDIGLKWQNGEQATYATANGFVKTYVISLDEVSVGGVTVHMVKASVTPNTQNMPILLGMSFLKHFDITQSDTTLTLTRKY